MRILMLSGLVLLMMIAGCADQETLAPITEPEQPESIPVVQQITVGMTFLPVHVDPALAVTEAELTMVHCLYDGLVRLDDSRIARPALAERWEASADARQWTFYLRPNLTWSDGTPITAADIRKSWLRLLHPDTASPHAYHLHQITGARQYAATGENEQEVAITASGLRLDVDLDQSVSHFPDICALPPLFPVQTSRLSTTGRTSGPFIIETYSPATSAILIPNPRYWDRTTVTLEKITMVAADAQTRLELFLEGTIDIADSLSISALELLSDDDRLQTQTDNATYYLMLNTHIQRLSDPAVRRALSMSIDRTYLTSTITRSGEQPALAFVPPGHINPDTGQDFRLSAGPLIEDDNSDHARSLLAKAGYPGGRGFPALTIITNASDYHRQVLTSIGRMWQRELGLLPITITELDWNSYLEHRNMQEYEVARAGWGADYFDPMSFLSLLTSDHPHNSTGFADPDYDMLINAASSITGDRRTTIIQEAEALLMTHMPIIPLFYYADNYLMQPHLQNLLRHPFGPSFCFKQVQVTNSLTETQP